MEPEELIAQEQEMLNKIAGRKLEVTASWDDEYGDGDCVSWSVQPYGQVPVGGKLDKHAQAFPTCCGVYWAGYFNGLTERGRADLRESLALLYLTERWAFALGYAAVVMVSADVSEEAIKLLKDSGWQPNGEFLNTAHGSTEALGTSAHKLIVWVKDLTKQQFKKWGAKPKAKAKKRRHK